MMVMMIGGDSDGGGDGTGKASVLHCFVNIFVYDDSVNDDDGLDQGRPTPCPRAKSGPFDFESGPLEKNK